MMKMTSIEVHTSNNNELSVMFSKNILSHIHMAIKKKKKKYSTASTIKRG